MHRILTYGYQSSDPATLLHYVDTLGALLVDIRYAPYSRDPRWTGDAIRELVGRTRYIHVRALGNRNYNNGGPIELAAPDFAARALRGALAQRPIILLCVCANVETCHRKVAADYLAAEFGVPVEHLPARVQVAGASTIRALSLTQPWASLVAIGAKRIETRSWQTSYRGPLAIHAAKAFPKTAREFAWRGSLAFGVLQAAGFESLDDLPLGCVIATTNLVDCRRTEEVQGISPQERAFGDYSWGRWAWILRDTVALPEPVPARGALGLWSWDNPSA